MPSSKTGENLLLLATVAVIGGAIWLGVRDGAPMPPATSSVGRELSEAISRGEDVEIAIDPLGDMRSNIEKIDKDLKVIVLDKNDRDAYTMRVESSPRSVWSESMLIMGAALDFSKIGKVAASSGIELDQLIFDVIAPTTDKYGNSKPDWAMTMRLAGSEVLKVNWENIGPSGILNLVESSFSPVGYSAAIEYCKDDEHLKHAGVFCRRALVR